MFAFLIAALGSASTAVAQDDSEATPEQIQAWISQLSSDNYSERQLATIELSTARELAVVPILQAISGADNEKSERLFQFLSDYATQPDSKLGVQALDLLNDISRGSATSKAIRAKKLLQVVAESQRSNAIDFLRYKGIDIRSRSFQVLTSRLPIEQALVIDKSFRGEPSDLTHLKWITNVEFVRLEGPKINREVLQHVSALPHLKKIQIVETPSLTAADLEVLRDCNDIDLFELIYVPIGDESIPLLGTLPLVGNVHLFGTKITAEGKTRLTEVLEGTDLFIARGGFLGVECAPSSLLINAVTPGGAAFNAGLQSNDRLLAINKAPIQVFDDLRRELAKYSDGETVDVELERRAWLPTTPNPAPGPTQRLTFKVVLGKRSDRPRE